MMTELKRPYVDLTSWVQALWDAINELRDESKAQRRIAAENSERITRLEAAVGNGVYDEYAAGPEGRTVCAAGEDA